MIETYTSAMNAVKGLSYTECQLYIIKILNTYHHLKLQFRFREVRHYSTHREFFSGQLRNNRRYGEHHKCKFFKEFINTFYSQDHSKFIIIMAELSTLI